MVSVVIPTYNRAHLLSQVLDSFAAQTIDDWECIVVDDHSTDNTFEIVQSYMNNDNRFKYQLNVHAKGAQGARNTGIKNAQGDWIALFDSDDYAYPNYLEELVRKISDDVSVVTSKARLIDSMSNQFIRDVDWSAQGMIQKSLLTGDIYISFNGCIIRRAELERIGGLDEKCSSHQEYDTHIRLSENCIYTTTEKILSDYFINASDTISVDSKKHIEGYLYILRKHKTLWKKNAYRAYLRRIRSLWFDEHIYKVDTLKYRLLLLSLSPLAIIYIVKYYLSQIIKNE